MNGVCFFLFPPVCLCVPTFIRLIGCPDGEEVEPLEVGGVVPHHLFMAPLVIIPRWQLIAECTLAHKHAHR